MEARRFTYGPGSLMKNTFKASRRTILTASAAALLPMQQAVAQAASRGGDWMAMVQVHHAAIAKSFEDVLATAAKPVAARNAALKRLAYQLTAHSVAEENVLYPALALNGMVTESDKLYLDQAHAKVMNAEIDFQAMMPTPSTSSADWTAKVKMLQAAVLKHAKDDEEGDLFPKLKQKLDAKMNATMTSEYRQHFALVKPF